MSGNRLFDPSSSLKIRDPQNNASHNEKIVNPPRYMELGGLEKGSSRGFHNNTFKVRSPGATLTKVPFKHD